MPAKCAARMLRCMNIEPQKSHLQLQVNQLTGRNRDRLLNARAYAGTAVDTTQTGGPESGLGERPGMLGSLAQRLQERVRATIHALGQSHAQPLFRTTRPGVEAVA